MGALIAFGAVGFVIMFWIMWTRTARQKWVRDLDLIGQWELDGENKEDVRIEFIGTRGDSGNYMASQAGQLDSGSWFLKSGSLVLEPQGKQPNHYELRRFSPGMIGINGPGREYQTFRKKKQPNVIKLHEHQSKNP